MSEYHPVEIEEAKRIAMAHGLEQIVVWSFRTGQGQHVTTWGDPLRHSALAAEAGNHVKRAAGWPPEKCQDLPGSLVDLFAAADSALAPDIRNGVLHKGTVLATLLAIRDVVRERDPQLAERFIPTACEAAEPQTALGQLDREEGGA